MKTLFETKTFSLPLLIDFFFVSITFVGKIKKKVVVIVLYSRDDGLMKKKKKSLTFI